MGDVSTTSTNWLNGKPCDQISIADRGLMYGQSVFETIAIANNKPYLLDAHLNRLEQGCHTLNIKLDTASLLEEIKTAVGRVERKAVLRISITMGEGGRGYKNPVKSEPNRILSLNDYPTFSTHNYTAGIELGQADIRLAKQPALAGIKHSNRLEQIIARSQWQDHWQEALLLDIDDQVIEATQSNVFIVADGAIKTPDLSQAGVAGVMRDFVLSKAELIGANCQIVPLSVSDIKAAQEVFVTNSLIGLWPVKVFQEQHYSDFTISQKLIRVIQDHGAIPNI